ILASIGEQDKLLKALVFDSNREDQNIVVAPNHVIQELGTPTAMLTNISPTEAIDVVVDLILAYKTRIVFYYQRSLPAVEHITNGTTDSLTVEVCLGGPQWNGEVFIMEPIQQNLPEEVSQLNPLQYQSIGSIIEVRNLR